MSFVSILGYSNGISVMSDGLATDKSKNVISEDFKKFRVIKDKAIISFSGSYTNFDELYNSSEEVINNSLSLKGTFNDIGDQIKLIPFDERYSKIKFLGAWFEQGVGYFISQDNQKPKSKIVLLGSNISYMFAHSNSVSEKQLTDQLRAAFMTYYRANRKIDFLAIQKQLNNFVASKDETVNQQVFFNKIQNK